MTILYRIQLLKVVLQLANKFTTEVSSIISVKYNYKELEKNLVKMKFGMGNMLKKFRDSATNIRH